MSTTPSSLFGRRATSGSTPPRRRHLVLKIFLGIVIFLAVLIAGLVWFTTTPKFANIVRTKLIQVLEDSTGGKVNLGAFRFSLLHLQIEADNLTIHGLEGPGEAPYVHLDKLIARVKIISLFRAQIGLDYLGVDKPEVHIIVYKNGTTNQPVPKTKSAPLNVNKTIDQIFDLEANRAEINDGTFLLNQKAIPFSLAANDLEVGVNYLAPTDQYKATLTIADITARRSIAAPVHSQLSIAAIMGRNELTVSDLHLKSGDSTLAAHAHVSNFNDPHWQASADGTVDLREAEALAAIPGLDQGVIGLKLQGQGTTSLFDVNGHVTVAGATYKGSGVSVRGLNAATDIHVTQDVLAADHLRATLASGGLITGNAHIDHWLAPTTPPSAPAAPGLQPGPKAEAAARAARAVNRTVAGATTNAQAKAQVSEGAAEIHLSGFTLPSILSVVAPPKYQHLGFATTASGVVDAHWTGNASDLAADVNVALTPPATPANGDIPVSGEVAVSYAGSTNSLVVRQLNVDTPGAHLQATGGVGLAAGAHASLQVQATVSDLGEFNRPLAVLGLGGKNGGSALPVALHGQASFNGVVTGNLAAPHVTGHLAANNFDILLNQIEPQTAHTSATEPTNPQGQHVVVPVVASGPSTPQTFHVDSLTADFAYEPSLLSVQSAVVTQGAMQVHLSGQLQPHHTRKGWEFDHDAKIDATASIAQAPIPGLLALAGESSVPLTGTLNLNVHAGGTLGDLNGGGHLSVSPGVAYGQPYQGLDADLVFAGQQVGASQLTLRVGGGSITGSGSYNLTTKRFEAQARSNELAIQNFEAVKKSPLAVKGDLAFAVSASGTIEHPAAQAEIHLHNLVVSNPAGEGPAATGAVDLTAHTVGDTLTAQMVASLSGATAKLDSRISTKGDFDSQSTLTLSNLDINPFLSLFNVTGIRGTSQLSGRIQVSGPLKTPKQLNGTAQLSKISIEAQNIAIGTDGPLNASLTGGVVRLQPVHITGPGTDLRLQGRASLFGSPRPVHVDAAGNLDLTVAHTLDPDVHTTGDVSLNMTVRGTIEHPDLEGSIDFHDDNLAYGDFPNGVNHLTGSLVFDQGRLTPKNLHATSGGGQLTFGGFITYQAGIYGDLTVTGNQVRVRYPSGVSIMVNAKIRAQGTLQNMLVSGGVQVVRFTVFPDVDLSALSSNGISPPPDPTAFPNHIRLDIHVTSSPQLNIANTYAKLAGDINLFIRGTAEDPSVLGNISITEGEATFAGTHYVLQHGQIYFTNPVKIEPNIDLEASAHVEDYSIIIGLHGTPDKLTPVFRSEPPLSEQDIFSLLALGRTQEEESIYSEQQSQAGVNSTANSILGGALNATLSSRINKLFGGGSVKIDPNFVSGAGNSTARITVQQQIGKQLTVTYATNVNSTAEQLIQGQYNLTPNLSILALRDESGVFSFEITLHRRYR